MPPTRQHYLLAGLSMILYGILMIPSLPWLFVAFFGAVVEPYILFDFLRGDPLLLFLVIFLFSVFNLILAVSFSLLGHTSEIRGFSTASKITMYLFVSMSLFAIYVYLFVTGNIIAPISSLGAIPLVSNIYALLTALNFLFIFPLFFVIFGLAISEFGKKVSSAYFRIIGKLILCFGFILIYPIHAFVFLFIFFIFTGQLSMSSAELLVYSGLGYSLIVSFIGILILTIGIRMCRW